MGITIDDERVNGVTIDDTIVRDITIDGKNCFKMLYDDDTFEDRWDIDLEQGDSEVQFNEDHIYLLGSATFAGSARIITSEIIDLSDYNDILVDWKFEGGTTENTRYYLYHTDDNDNYNTIKEGTDPFERRTDIFDISDINESSGGISFRSRDADDQGLYHARLYVYKALLI